MVGQARSGPVPEQSVLLPEVQRAEALRAPQTPLVGREAECDLLRRLAENAANLRAGDAMLFVGPPGIGKTRLLEHAHTVANSAGLRTLAVNGSRAERGLPHAGLHQLLAPLLAQLPVPTNAQAATLRSMFSSAGPQMDPFLVAATTLDVLVASSEQEPLLVTIDDMRWLDSQSAEAIAFVGHRLAGHAIAMLGARRPHVPGHQGDWGFPEHHVGPLNPTDAGNLLEILAPDLAQSPREQVLSAAAGNPLALRELRATSSETAFTWGSSRSARLTAELGEAFSDGLEALPQTTRDALLVAACADRGDLGEVVTAASIFTGTSVTIDSLDSAVDAGLVVLSRSRIHFRHPLTGRAIVESVPVAQRRRAHESLAAVTADPSRRTWHRASATWGRDDDVAEAAEGVARRAVVAGVLDTAVGAMARAGELTEKPRPRARRYLEAAELARSLGRPDAVRDLLAVVAEEDLDARDRMRLRALVQAHGLTSLVTTSPLVENVAQARLGRPDDDARLGLLLTAAMQSWRDGATARSRAQIVSAAQEGRNHRLDPRVVAILGVASPLEHGADVLERLSMIDALETRDPGDQFRLGLAAFCVGDPARAETLLSTAAASLRHEGRTGQLTQALSLWSHAAINLGHWDIAAEVADECIHLAGRTGELSILAQAHTAAGIVAAVRGDDDQASELLTRSQGTASRHGLTGLGSLVQLGRGIAALCAGRHDEAWVQLRQIQGEGTFSSQRVMLAGVSYLAEAAVHTGRAADARALILEVESVATTTSAPLPRAAAAYARLVTMPNGTAADADRAFTRALTACPADWTFDRARINLARGLQLRRVRRIGESRLPLREAWVGFERLGAASWAKQAEDQLRATGERTSRRDVGEREALTAQEELILRMAAAGMSNREIGKQLYLSHRTVGSHLYRAFPKLGISSRSQLTGLLPERQDLAG